MTQKNLFLLIAFNVLCLTTSLTVSAENLPSSSAPTGNIQGDTIPKMSAISVAANTPEKLYVGLDEIDVPAYRLMTSDVVTFTEKQEKPQKALKILGEKIEPGQQRELTWSAGQSFSGQSIDPPVLITRGEKAGPVLCLISAIHGDELNGIELVRRVMGDLDAEDLSGTVIGVPIVNIYGFSSNSRYMPDRRDLNRYFPGREHGSSASRTAYLFFNQIIKHCDRLVDIHTGSFKRTNLPQLRADLNNPQVLDFTRYFGSTAVLHKTGKQGTLRAAATNAGIPAVTFELGQPAILQNEHVDFGVKAVETLMDKLGMIKKLRLWSEPQPVYYGSRWVRADKGGILSSMTKIGGLVKKGDVLGYIINPLNSERSELLSPEDGRILGMALNQFMLPGYAAFNIGIISTKTPKGYTRQTSEENADSEKLTVPINKSEELEPYEQEEYD